MEKDNLTYIRSLFNNDKSLKLFGDNSRYFIDGEGSAIMFDDTRNLLINIKSNSSPFTNGDCGLSATITGYEHIQYIDTDIENNSIDSILTSMGFSPKVILSLKVYNRLISKNDAENTLLPLTSEFTQDELDTLISQIEKLR